jgi:hypothetical protein
LWQIVLFPPVVGTFGPVGAPFKNPVNPARLSLGWRNDTQLFVRIVTKKTQNARESTMPFNRMELYVS